MGRGCAGQTCRSSDDCEEPDRGDVPRVSFGALLEADFAHPEMKVLYFDPSHSSIQCSQDVYTSS